METQSAIVFLPRKLAIVIYGCNGRREEDMHAIHYGIARKRLDAQHFGKEGVLPFTVTWLSATMEIMKVFSSF